MRLYPRFVFLVGAAHSPRSRQAASEGFTLVELLAVMAIMALLLGLGVPALTQVTEGQGLNQSINSLSDLVDYARTEALAKNTFIWMGFHNSPATEAGNTSGGDEVIVTVMESLDGTASAAPASIQPVVVPTALPNLVLGGVGTINPSVQALIPASSYAADVTSNGNPKTLPAQGKVSKYEYTLTFSPSGTAMINGVPSSSSGFDRAIDCAFCYRIGGAAKKVPLDFDLRLNGGSGRIDVYRL